jgi:ribokinase
VTCTRLPAPGETVLGNGSVISVGGKGANQAVAAARCGATTRFVARIGDDAFGRLVTEALDANGVDRGWVGVVRGGTTGLATILVDAAGQNCITVVPGANAALDPPAIDALEGLLAETAVVVLQHEIPAETVYRTIDLAVAAGAAVVLNPAPYRPLDLERLAGRVTWLIPNEHEAAALCDFAVDTPDSAARAAGALREAGFANVIITLGARGCLVATGTTTRLVAPLVVDAIDTTGAGDAFVGCLAAALAQGASDEVAVHRAIVYSALSTTRRGAQSSYATHDEFARALAASH